MPCPAAEHAARCPAQDVDEDTRRFQAQSARLMGDMKEAGDAPFGGEVELDSKVRPRPSELHPILSIQAHVCCK